MPGKTALPLNWSFTGAYWIALLLQVKGISCFVDEDSCKMMFEIIRSIYIRRIFVYIFSLICSSLSDEANKIKPLNSDQLSMKI